MTREKIFNGIGFGLLGVAFLYSLLNHFTRHEETADGDEVTVIRFAHWRLEEPTLEAFEWAAAEYHRLHPDVRVVQMDIPLRTWQMWMHAQLIGETAPDMLAIHGGFINDVELARHFLPLTAWMKEPNPYNEGTPLEGEAWHKTFANDLNVGSAFRPMLLDFYGVPTTLNLMRLVLNRDLFEKVAGADAEVPTTFEEFVALNRKLQDYRSEDGSRVFLIAGSRERTYPLLNRFIRGVTQTEYQYVDWNRDGDIGMTAGDILWARQNRGWEWTNPRMTSGMEASRELMNMQIPAFQQQRQDDALFYFLQERSLALPVFAIDAPNIQRLAQFATEIVPEIPMPEAGSEPYGVGTLGPFGEGDSAYSMPQAVTRYSEHPEIAIDFLRFLTSWKINPEFARRSGLSPMLPDLPEELAPRSEFSPNLEGFSAGLGVQLFSTGVHEMFGYQDSMIHRIVDPAIPMEELLAEMSGPLWETYLRDLERTRRQQLNGTQRLDAVVPAYGAPSAAPEADRFDALVRQQMEQEADYYRLGKLLANER